MHLFATKACALVAACSLLVALGGCRDDQGAAASVESLAEKYERLPGLRSSTSPFLQTAFGEIEAERQLPAQLGSASVKAPYAALERAYPAMSRGPLQRDVEQVWPEANFQFSPGALQRARDLVKTHAAARSRLATAVEQLSPQPQLRIRHRLSGTESWLDAATIAARMEGFAAAETLAEGEPEEALPMLARMLKISAQFAREADLHARLTGAAIRRDSLQVLSAIANHPTATRGTLERLQQMLAAHTSDWPTEESVWIAERAAGLLVYELVRDGHYLNQLPREEVAELNRLGLTAATSSAVLRNIDDDQAFYLRAMKLQIAATRQPYFERATVIEQLQAELQIRRESGSYPQVAGSLLLSEVGEVHRRLAEDRCRCEVWLIVLASVLGQPLESLPPNPLTGRPYELNTDRERVAINDPALPASEQVQVRRPGVVQAQRRAAGFDLRQR
jgi:hypothetical protein